MKKVKTKLLITWVWMGLFSQPLFAQEQPLKDLLAERSERTYAFYASTLRMINLTQNPDYNELVNGVEKVLVIKLDSTARAEKSYLNIEPMYLDKGYEEYAKAYGGDWNMLLLGKESRTNQFVGFFGEKNSVFTFYLRGSIAWEKVPALINTLRNDELLNLFDSQ